MSLAKRRPPRFVVQLHDRNISFVKSKDEPAEKRDEIEYFKDGRLHTAKRDPQAAEDANAPFKNAVALIETLQGSDAFGVDRLPNAKHNEQFDKMAGGLFNPGINICFMNVILQVLTHSPYLAPAMMRAAHSRVCPNAKRKIVCVTCVLEAHVKQALGNRVAKKNPYVHLVQRLIWKQYQLGRQEDAFIFLKHLLDALIKGCYGSRYSNSTATMVPQNDAMRSFIGRIFGGFLKNVLMCSHCHYRSEKLETCFDISVDIYRANNLADLLTAFVKEETLDHNNRYNCPKCKRHQKATKAMSIYRAPKIMNVVLKRFGMGATGCEKSKKEVSFPLSFSMSIHTSKQSKPVWLTYDLYAVVCHLGRSLHMGHYIAFVRGQHGFWSCFNDASVSTVSQEAVLGLRQEAYLLFYAVNDECAQICDLLTNDKAVTNTFTTKQVPVNRNLQTTTAHYRNDVLREDSLADDAETDNWPKWPLYESVKRKQPAEQQYKVSLMSPSSGTSTDSAEETVESNPESHNELDTSPKVENPQMDSLRVVKRFVTRRVHGHRLKLIGLFKQYQVSQDVIRDIMRIKEQLKGRRGAAADEEPQKQQVRESDDETHLRPLDTAADSDVDTWSDADPGDAYHQLKSSIHPELPKRSQEDVDYDRGKLKKVRSAPQPPLGGVQYVTHNSGTKIAVHQKDAFDSALGNRARKRRHAGNKRRRSRNRR
ncbi:ubiquitin carboxyl-terminal hydrolase family protein, putative [Babesia bigemina]|uniref:ubiquitinyl hydrolase 1 n=1 Tax=Babesia bigemina TaxID=5866 RepID=A0A061DE89_BABBI|nr:ubiquitin carboxyl-terminal hydrolase family protein, putative [Babesia bigemina]CDR96930.1 ubiquitin carboxyl-terminal hydrolase family protein, putative [Babesia bigemina]|eukprot:XP_012769116.1 ubiquitin carboxyl-terminal hydrolase family protein, putative [Babesia bigemina]